MKSIIEKLSKELNLPESVIIKTYKNWWKFIKLSIEDLPLKEDLTEEEFNKLRPNFNIPGLGKLGVTYNNYKRIKEKYKKSEDVKRKENQTNVQLHSGH